MLRRFLPLLLVMVFPVLGIAADSAPMPWNLEALSKPPQTYDAPGFQEWGVKAVFYEGLPFQGKPTRVFAWYSTPGEGHKSPGIVLVHGGGGTAFAAWVRLWSSRGYAAIAMDNCGGVPKGEYGKWERHEFSGPNGWGGFDQIDAPVEDQWSYHAIADVILAHSLLRSMPGVDPERIGVTGISWGGYLTCISAGVDKRFKFAVPVYGCGFLGEDSAWLDTFKGMGPEKTAKWLALWDPSVYLPRAAMPMLWVTGTNDFAYPMDSLQKSYHLPTGPHALCLRVRMPHGHGGAGENPEEIRAFADNVVSGKPALAKITAQGRKGKRVWIEYESTGPIVGASLQFTCDTGKWQDRKWDILPAELNMKKHRATAEVPDGATVYYFNLTDPTGLVVSSEHVEEKKPS